jgi:hypothetical protein
MRPRSRRSKTKSFIRWLLRANTSRRTTRKQPLTLATEHLKLGQVKAPVKVDPLAKIKGVSNPYDDAWKGTEEARQAAIVALLASKDPDALRRVASFAKAGGRSISGQKLQPVGAARFAKK